MPKARPSAVGRDLGISTSLAQWVAEVDDVPEHVQDAARLLLLDGLGCGLFGSTLPWARIVAGAAALDGDAGHATIWGTGAVVPLTGAPLANGTAVHAFEFDDLHPVAVLHAGAQVIPAALAVAEARARAAAGQAAADLPASPVTDRELLTAIVCGFEVGARIGIVTGAGQLARGFHPSPNTGTFSAAAATARLLGLPATTTAHAFGIAGSFGGFLMAAQYGAMVKRVHPGRSSQAGLTAALLAARGLTGIQDVLEAPYGGFARTFAGVDPAEVQEVVRDLGQRWEVPAFSIKAYPCCGSNHTCLDAVTRLREASHTLIPQDIERIDVYCSTLTRDHVGWPYQPDSVTTAQMNLRYCLAALVADGVLGVDQFAEQRLADPRLVSLARRINVIADPQIDALGRSRRHTVRLVVTTTDGRRLEQQVDHARGSRHHPLSRDEVIAKYRDLAGRVLTEASVLEIEGLVLSLGSGSHQSSSTARLAHLLAGTNNESS